MRHLIAYSISCHDCSHDMRSLPVSHLVIHESSGTIRAQKWFTSANSHGVIARDMSSSRDPFRTASESLPSSAPSPDSAAAVSSCCATSTAGCLVIAAEFCRSARPAAPAGSRRERPRWPPPAGAPRRSAWKFHRHPSWAAWARNQQAHHDRPAGGRARRRHPAAAQSDSTGRHVASRSPVAARGQPCAGPCPGRVELAKSPRLGPAVVWDRDPRPRQQAAGLGARTGSRLRRCGRRRGLRGSGLAHPEEVAQAHAPLEGAENAASLPGAQRRGKEHLAISLLATST